MRVLTVKCKIFFFSLQERGILRNTWVGCKFLFVGFVVKSLSYQTKVHGYIKYDSLFPA